MAIQSALPVRVNGSITTHIQDVDIERDPIPEQFRVCFTIQEVNGHPVLSETSGYFIVPEARLPEFLSGQYHWIGYMGYVSYLHTKFGITHLIVNSETFEVSDAW